MARRINVEELNASEAQVLPLNYAKVKEEIERLITQRETIATENAEAGHILSRLEDGHGLEKGGIKLACSFAKMSEEKRSDRLRSFLECMKALDAMPATDLVDLMRGEAK